MSGIFELLWSHLPDKCQVVDCSRRGVRGNENRIGGKIVCDYCHSRQGHLNFGSSWWDRHPRARWPVVIGYTVFAIGGLVCFTVAIMRHQ